jgi:hypothetical protein
MRLRTLVAHQNSAEGPVGSTQGRAGGRNRRDTQGQHRHADCVRLTATHWSLLLCYSPRPSSVHSQRPHRPQQERAATTSLAFPPKGKSRPQFLTSGKSLGPRCDCLTLTTALCRVRLAAWRCCWRCAVPHRESASLLFRHRVDRRGRRHRYLFARADAASDRLADRAGPNDYDNLHHASSLVGASRPAHSICAGA